jgi:fucose permease
MPHLTQPDETGHDRRPHPRELAGEAAGRPRHVLTLTASLYLLMFAYAVSCTMLGPLIPVLRREYALTLSQAGLMTTLQGVGGSLSVFMGILVTDLLRRSTSVRVTFAIYCASPFLIVLLPGYQALLVVFFLIGASTRLLDSFVNAYIADVHHRHRGFYLTLLHASFGVGALLGPSVSVFVLHENLRWVWVFVGLGVFCLCVLAAYVAAERAYQREMAAAERSDTTRPPPGSRGDLPSNPCPSRSAGLFAGFVLLRSRAALVPCLLGLLYVGFANGLSVWIPSYVQQVFHRTALQASLPVSTMWVGIITGRVVFSFLSRVYRVPTLLAIGNTVAAVVAVAVIGLNTYLALTAGLAFVGFLVGATNPLAYSHLRETFPENGGAMASALTFFGTVGLMTIPWVAGFVADRTEFWYGLVTLGLCPCGLAILSLYLLRMNRHPLAAPAR